MSFAYGFPSEYSGTCVVRCIASGGTTFRGVAFTEGQEVDLLDKDTDPAIRCYDYYTATRFCTDGACPMAIAIAAGDFEIVSTTPPSDQKLTRELAQLWEA